MNGIWLYGLLSVSMLSSALAILALLQCRRLRARALACEAEMRALRVDFAALSAASTGVGKQLAQLDRQVRRAAERQDQLELRDAGDRPYAQAIRMVQNGADVKELMSTCALTQGEAELLVLLHGMKKTG